MLEAGGPAPVRLRLVRIVVSASAVDTVCCNGGVPGGGVCRAAGLLFG
jgi:hypothetical protein